MSILDNPSLDTGAVADPFIPYGWINSGLDAGDSEIEIVVRHSEGASLQFNVGAVAGEKITQQLVLASGKFFHFGAWTYGDGAGAGFKLNCVNAVLASNPAVSTLNTPHTAAWSRTVAVWRATAANPTVEIEADDGAGAARYVDDLTLETADDVTLTCTPASAANSLEGSGIRVDGLDRLTQPIPVGMFFPNHGLAQFPITPRHADTTVALFGNLTPTEAYFFGDATNYIHLDWSAANTLRLRYNAGGAGVQTGTWATGGGMIVPGTQYQTRLEYSATGMKIFVQNALRIQIFAPVIFSVVPTLVYWGSNNLTTQQIDAVYG